MEDSPYFPSLLRNFQTDFTGFVQGRFNFYDHFIKYINELDLPHQPMTDLCSGSGEPAISIFKRCKSFTSLTLTDKYPHPAFKNTEQISYLTQSVDVLDKKFQPEKYYTMFNAFHHFCDEEKTKLAESISSAGSHGFFAEVLEPTPLCFLKVLFITTIGNIFLSPFIKPFSLTRIVLTYIIPINILTITYDGIVSVFKSRSLSTYRKMFAENERIEIFKMKNGWTSVIVIWIKPGNKHG